MECKCVMVEDPMLASSHGFDCEVYKAYAGLENAITRPERNKSFFEKLLEDLG